VSVSIYNDPRLDCISRASASGQMFQMLRVEQTDRWVDKCSGAEAAGVTDRQVSGATEGKVSGAADGKVARRMRAARAGVHLTLCIF
jgi:hypothetical protein